jgi:hypothetical protein
VAFSKAMDARKSVVAVLVFRSSGMVHSGSGFVIKCDHDAIVITSSHFIGVLHPEDVLYVRRPLHPTGVEQLSAILVDNNDLLAIAILRVPGLMSVLPLSFAQEPIIIGESVISIEYCDPDALFTSVTFLRLPALSPGIVMYVFFYYCYL